MRRPDMRQEAAKAERRQASYDMAARDPVRHTLFHSLNHIKRRHNRCNRRDVRYGPKADMPKNAIDAAIGGKADMTVCGSPLLRSLFGAKRTSLFALHMSTFDPKQTEPRNLLRRTVLNRLLYLAVPDAVLYGVPSPPKAHIRSALDPVRLVPLAEVRSVEDHQLKRSELSFYLFMLLRVSCERTVAKPVHIVRAV